MLRRRRRTDRALDLDLLVAVDISNLVRRTIAANHVFEHGSLITTRLLRKLGAQMFLGVVQRILDQGGVCAAQRSAKLFQIFGDRAWRIHYTPPCKTLSTESRVAVQAATHSRNASRPGLVMR